MKTLGRASQRIIKMIKQFSNPREPFQRVIAGRLPKHFARDRFLSQASECDTVTVSVLKALGDENNPAHWETWTSPEITIARP